MRLLIGRGAQIEQRDAGGYNAFLHAAAYGHTDILKLLLENGTRIDYRANNDWDALTAAAANDREAATLFLISSGAEIDGRGRWTPLIAASHFGREKIVSILLDRGASVSHLSDDGSIALVAAASRGHAAVVTLLLERGANVNDTNHDGTPAIMGAAGEARNDVVEILLDRGADPNQSTAEGGTAIMLAAQNDHASTVRLLLERSADPLAAMRDGSDRTAITFARDNNREEVLAILLQSTGGVEARGNLSPSAFEHNSGLDAAQGIPASDWTEHKSDADRKRRAYLTKISAMAFVAGIVIAMWWAWHLLAATHTIEHQGRRERAPTSRVAAILLAARCSPTPSSKSSTPSGVEAPEKPSEC